MTPLQRLQLRQSETRSSLNALLLLDELDDEQRAEMATLTTSMQNLEVETRAAIVAEGDPTVAATEHDTAAREMRALVAGASIAGIFAAAMEHRATSGREAELQQHLGLGPNQIPLALIRGDLETRATGVTQAPTNVGQNQAEIIPAVFPQSCAAFLGIDSPTVGVGEAIYPVLTTGADVGTPAENAAQAETAGAFTADVLSPSRIQASFFYSREDRARFMGMDSALRINLSEALSDKLDQQVLNGNEGLFSGTKLPNHNVNAVSSFALYRSGLVYGRIDGTFASMEADLKVVVGSETLAHMSTVYQSGQSSEMSVLDSLRRIGVPVKVSAHVPGASGSKQNAVIRRGMRRDMVTPIWEGVTLLPDEITKAKEGQIVITAIMLHAVKILRADGFHKQQVQHA